MENKWNYYAKFGDVYSILRDVTDENRDDIAPFLGRALRRALISANVAVRKLTKAGLVEPVYEKSTLIRNSVETRIKEIKQLEELAKKFDINLDRTYIPIDQRKLELDEIIRSAYKNGFFKEKERARTQASYGDPEEVINSLELMARIYSRREELRIVIPKNAPFNEEERQELLNEAYFNGYNRLLNYASVLSKEGLVFLEKDKDSNQYGLVAKTIDMAKESLDRAGEYAKNASIETDEAQFVRIMDSAIFSSRETAKVKLKYAKKAGDDEAVQLYEYFMTLYPEKNQQNGDLSTPQTEIPKTERLAPAGTT